MELDKDLQNHYGVSASKGSFGEWQGYPVATSCSCKKRNGFWRNDSTLDLSSPRQVQTSWDSFLLSDKRLKFIVRCNLKHPCQAWKFTMFQEKQRKYLTSNKAWFLLYSTGRGYFVLFPSDFLPRNRRWIRNNQLCYLKTICPLLLLSEATAAFLPIMKFIFPRLVGFFVVNDRDGHTQISA